MDQNTANKIIEELNKNYPDAKCELNHGNSFQLLIAVMLSAQCTDIRVNIVTEELFNNCSKPEDIISLGKEELERIIKPCGFYKNKSRNILETCQKLIDIYSGNVPNNFEQLISLPGVGRKTANVVLSVAFDIPTIPVDTHVFRVSNRIGLVDAKDPEETEQQLMNIIRKEDWIRAPHLLIFHGRRACSARNPKCKLCNIFNYCYFTKRTL